MDGEGCIYAHPSALYIQIEIAQKIKAPLFFIADRYGGNVRKCKNIYKWLCPSKNIEKFLIDIIPFLLVKNVQAKAALEYRGLQGSRNSSSINMIRRIELCKIISEDKHASFI